MLIARLTPVSVVFSAVSPAYFLASVSSYPFDQTCNSQRTSVRSSPLMVSGTEVFPSSKRTSVIAGLQGDGGGRCDLGRRAIAPDLAPEAFDDFGEREALLTGGRSGGGGVVDDRADRHERADQQ